MSLRNLVMVLGDQLDADSAAFEGFDPARDAVWMAEVATESTKVWSSKPRIAVFLAGMRHFREALIARGWPVMYRELNDTGGHWLGAPKAWTPRLTDGPEPETLPGALRNAIEALRPERVVWVHPGEWDVREALCGVARGCGVELLEVEDRHFLCSLADFQTHANRRKQLRLEFFYREQRQRLGVLMDNGEPCGGAWNFDEENRRSFGNLGPPFHKAPRRFPPDGITQEVITLVNTRFAGHPGELGSFDWPVTAAESREALEDFIEHRLPEFGLWQDALWTGEPWLFHSRLSAAMNLKLLHPRTVIDAAEQAYRQGRVPLPAAEGFVRQILGWREYVRGVYWRFMPDYRDLNALEAIEPLPRFYWTGETDMNCLRESLGQTLRLGYAHHIQRLMVTGLYALLLGVDPRAVHEWYLAVYVDAVEWVELPNTLGMSQHGDGGLMASKPYIASGKYIQRMSNYCAGCAFDPGLAEGPKACPFTTLYWDFLMRHEARLRRNPRMGMQVRNLARLDSSRRQAIQAQAQRHREHVRTDAPPADRAAGFGVR